MGVRRERARDCKHVAAADRRQVRHARERCDERSGVGVHHTLSGVGDEQLPARRRIDAEHRRRVEARIRLRGGRYEHARSDERGSREPHPSSHASPPSRATASSTACVRNLPVSQND